VHGVELRLGLGLDVGEARVAVRMFLDLTVTALAGGAGIEQSLSAAARDGQGPVFRRIREALDEAKLHRTAAWPHLDRVGTAIGIRELSELAATAGLAGSEGARVRTSISAKARAMRDRELADTIAEAEAATERGALPGAVLAVAFVIFIVYAAMAAAISVL